DGRLGSVGQRRGRSQWSLGGGERRRRVAGGQVLAVGVRGVLTLRAFRQHGLEFGGQRGGLAGAEATRRSFSRQRYSAVEQSGDLRQGAIRGLQQAYAVVGVLLGLRESSDVRLYAICNRQTGGVVRTGVDLQTGGELRQGLLQVHLRVGQRVLCSQRRDVVKDC